MGAAISIWRARPVGRSRGGARDRGTLHRTAARAHPAARLSHGQGERRPADRPRAFVFRRRSAYPRIQRRRPARAVDQGRRDPDRDRSAPHRPVDPAHRGRLAGNDFSPGRGHVGADDEGRIQARAGGGDPRLVRSSPPATAPSSACTSSRASASKRSRRRTASTASPSPAGSGPPAKRCSTGCAGGSGKSSGSSRRSSTAWRGWRGVSFRSIWRGCWRGKQPRARTHFLPTDASTRPLGAKISKETFIAATSNHLPREVAACSGSGVLRIELKRTSVWPPLVRCGLSITTAAKTSGNRVGRRARADGRRDQCVGLALTMCFDATDRHSLRRPS